MGIRKLINSVSASKAACFDRRAAFKLTALLCCALFASGCASVNSSEQAPAAQPAPRMMQAAPRALIYAHSSPEALTRQFLKALAAKDLTTLKQMRITKDEFCQSVWPELPSSRIQNLSCDFAWDQATLRSDGGLYDLLPRHGGKRYELISVTFPKGVDRYSGYKILKEPQLVVKDESGHQQEVRLFGSMLEMSGQFKLFSFVTD
ncbi:MAG TPA: hypothetical protein VF131_07070 [Blastocatellia bacterium]|nr:hypothetical protein [Blastocatellia bacterium]